MADILKFDVTCEKLLLLSKNALEEHDLVRHVDCLRRALKINPKCSEASLSLAQTYASLGSFDISNDVIFKALNVGMSDEFRPLFYSQLAMNYLDMEMPDVATYYLRDYEDEYDISYPQKDPKTEGFDLVRPRGEQYYENLIEKAYQLIKERRYDEAIELMDEVESGSQSKEAANHIVLICLMMKDDPDSVIENARKMLEKDGDSLVIRCTLATAMLMEEKTAEACAEVEDILKKDYTRMDDILLIMPLLVNLDMHSEVVKYSRRVLLAHEWQPNTMVWLAIALFNLGQKAEATKVMRQVDTIYGEYSPAGYFLDLFQTASEPIPYSMGLPQKEFVARMKEAEKLIRMPFDQFIALIEGYDEESEKAFDLMEWVLKEGHDVVREVIAKKLALVANPRVFQLFERCLVQSGLSYELFSTMFTALVDEPLPVAKINVVAQDRFKEICIFKPLNYFKLEEPLSSAVRLALSEIAFTDEEPETYIEELFEILKEIAPLEDRQPVRTKRLQRIKRLRSVKTIVGVLLGKVYEEDESREDIIARYELSARTYDRYRKIFFGDEDGNEE